LILTDYFKGGYKSATTADSDLGKRMTTRSSVDKNTVLVSVLPVKTKAKPIVTLSSDIFSPSQLGNGVTEDEQAIINEDPVSSKQQVDESVFEPFEFDDTAELKLDDTTEITINKSVVSEIFPDHSLSIIDEDDVILNTVSYPDTIEGCIKVISKQRHREKALHLINTENVNFWAVCKYYIYIVYIYIYIYFSFFVCLGKSCTCSLKTSGSFSID